MNRSINAIVAATLLLLSGNAMAIMIDDQLYGNSGYSLNDIDVAIQALQDDVSSKKDKKRLKKARKLDRKIERLVGKMDSAMVSGKEKKLRKKSKKLNRKEGKLLALLADYLPNLGELLQNGDVFTTNNLLLADEALPLQPDIVLAQVDLVTEPVTGNSGDNTPGNTVTGPGASSIEADAIPEPSMFVLLGLGFAGLMLHGRRWCRSAA